MSRRALGIVPARGGSRRIPMKNIAPSPAARCSRGHCARRWPPVWGGRIVVSTEHPKTRSVALERSAEAPFLRPGELAADDDPWNRRDPARRPLAGVRGALPTGPRHAPATDISPPDRAQHGRLWSASSSATPTPSSAWSGSPHNMIPESVMRMGPDGWPCRRIEHPGLLRSSSPPITRATGLPYTSRREGCSEPGVPVRRSSRRVRDAPRGVGGRGRSLRPRDLRVAPRAPRAARGRRGHTVRGEVSAQDGSSGDAERLST